MATSQKATLQKNDIQGLIVRGYSGLPAASFLLLQFPADYSHRPWFNGLADLLCTAEVNPKETAVNAALTHAGIEALGLAEAALSTFPRPFKEGMTEAHRQEVLGDYGDNAPENWKWGAPDQESVHMLLLCYAADGLRLEQLLSEMRQAFQAEGVKEIAVLETSHLPDKKEHFGFRDSISQPIIEGLSKTGPAFNQFPAGEFILGYPNVYQEYSPRPAIGETPSYEAPTAETAAADLGMNGSYLVLRQMSQDVHAFWNYMKASSMESGSKPAVTLAAKVVGRWPEGTPLLLSPDEEKAELTTANDFLYWNEDKKGMKCPIGSHVRRSNPRDHLVTEKTEVESMEMVRHHRLLRRGRAFGAPVSPTMALDEIMQAPRDEEHRGLYFMCFCAELTRQFEFVQNVWIKFHKFGGLYNDSDPLIGNHFQHKGAKTDEFTVPAQPLRRKYCAMPQFTRTEGGAYFFFPGIAAFRKLANLKPA